MPPISQSEVRELATWRGREVVTSCYLDVDGRRFVRQQDLEREVDNVLRRARARMNGNRSVHADLDRIRVDTGTDLPDETLARGVLLWSALFGTVSFEVFGQYGENTFADPGVLFEHHLDVLAETVGFTGSIDKS